METAWEWYGKHSRKSRPIKRWASIRLDAFGLSAHREVYSSTLFLN